MLQLILPQIISKICTFIIFILQLVIFFEYIWYFIKVYFNNINQDLISLFLDYDTSDVGSKTIEINILLVMYCYYIQKKNYQTSFYKDEKLDFEVYIIKKFEKIKILSFLQEIYVWILFVLLFITITSWYYQFLFSIKLLFFSILFYKFLSIKNIKSIKKYVWILILYCGINTMLIYFYQFKVLNLLNPIFENYFDRLFPDKILKNFDVIGLVLYRSSDLPLKLFPHYFSNFLSVLLLWEISRICELKDAERLENNVLTTQPPILITANNDNSMIKNTENKDDASKMEERIITFKKTPIKVDDKKDKPKSIGYYKFLITFYKFIFFLCRIYWLIIYAIVCLILSNVSFSFSIIVYIFFITLSFLLFFKKIMQRTERSISLLKNKLNVLKLIRYTIEKKNTTKWINIYRKSSFKMILFFALTFIFLTYIYTLIDFVQR